MAKLLGQDVVLVSELNESLEPEKDKISALDLRVKNLDARHLDILQRVKRISKQIYFGGGLLILINLFWAVSLYLK